MLAAAAFCAMMPAGMQGIAAVIVFSIFDVIGALFLRMICLQGVAVESGEWCERKALSRVHSRTSETRVRVRRLDNSTFSCGALAALVENQVAHVYLIPSKSRSRRVDSVCFNRRMSPLLLAFPPSVFDWKTVEQSISSDEASEDGVDSPWLDGVHSTRPADYSSFLVRTPLLFLSRVHQGDAIRKVHG